MVMVNAIQQAYHFNVVGPMIFHFKCHLSRGCAATLHILLWVTMSYICIMNYDDIFQTLP